MDEEENPDATVNLLEQLDKQEWQRKQEQQASGQGFDSFYGALCDRIRKENLLDSIIEEFEECLTDQNRIAYAWKIPEVQSLDLKPFSSLKSGDEAQTCEDLYDMLVVEEENASRALEVIHRAVCKTPVKEKDALAVRYMKRGWALLLQANFSEAYSNAKRSLSLATSPGLLWNAHEILGHCHAKMKEYKQSELHFTKALESLRKSGASNEEKAAVAVRVSSVLRMVKEENKPKNKAKETAKKQEEAKKKRHKNKKQAHDLNDESSSVLSVMKQIETPKISYGSHPKLENASSALSVVVKEGRGRCVIATKDIKAGSIVMVDKPFSSVVNSDQLHLRCNFCCQRTSAGIPCRDCAVVQFCSDECMKKGASLHRLECPVMSHVYDPGLGKMAPLVFRILASVSWSRLKKSRERLESEHDKEDRKERDPEVGSIMEGGETQKWIWNGKYNHKDYLPTFSLVSNSSKRSFGDLFKRSLSAVYISLSLKAAGFFGTKSVEQKDLLWVSSLALRHLQSSSCNAYEISEMQIKSSSPLPGGKSMEIGGAIYPTISLTNHGCFPNVTRYNLGRDCILRATRFIPKGSEVLDNYGYYFHGMSSVERRDILRTQYKFDCQCEACEESWPVYPHKAGEPVIFKCPACKTPTSYMEGRRRKCSKCNNQESFSKLIDEITEKVNCYSEILALMHEKKFEEAIEILIDQQEFFEPHACYPSKYFTDIQELMRQCFNCCGNVYIKESITKKFV